MEHYTIKIDIEILFITKLYNIETLLLNMNI